MRILGDLVYTVSVTRLDLITRSEKRPSTPPSHPQRGLKTVEFKMGQLYKISFKTSGRAYIGISSMSADIRFKAHSHEKNNYPIGLAFKKYGVDDAVLTILAEENDWATLCQMEIAAIAEHNTKSPNGYNITNGGEGVVGNVCTEEQNKANSERAKIRFSTPEARQANSERMTLYFSNPEARKAQSERKKAYFDSNPEAGKAHSERAKLWLSTPEARRANSERGKLRFSKQEERNAASERTKLYFSNPDARKAQSESQKLRFSNPEECKSISDRQKLRFSNPESRKVLSESQKLRFSNPEEGRAISKRQKLLYSTPEARARQKCYLAVGWAKKAGRPFSYLPKALNSNL